MRKPTSLLALPRFVAPMRTLLAAAVVTAFSGLLGCAASEDDSDTMSSASNLSEPRESDRKDGGTPSPDLELATKRFCMSCHAVDKKVIGPAFRDVAVKYRDVSEARGKLAKKVRNGGSGVWGPVPMPANTAPKIEEIDRLVQWILAME